MVLLIQVLVFDFGSEFYVWQGKGVSPEQRKQGMALARKLFSKGYDYSECAVNPMGPLRCKFLNNIIRLVHFRKKDSQKIGKE